MTDVPPFSSRPRHVLALESSTPHGGAALIREGAVLGVSLLPEGLRHGRELVPAASDLLVKHGVTPADLWGVAVSVGPGSYTGVRVGVMSAKALAYGTGARLAAVSSLAVLAVSMRLAGAAREGDRVLAVQDARRDEVYAGLYHIGPDNVEAVHPDAAVTPEEAAAMLRALAGDGGPLPRPVGSGFTTYPELFADIPGLDVSAVTADPAAAGWLGWRQFLREETADPLLLQPVYLRRDAGSDWRHDALIT